MLPVRNPQNEEEREIFPLKREEKDDTVKKGSRRFRVSFFNILSECLRGKGFVEIEVSEEEEAFEDNEKDFGTLNIKESDI